ncbi:DUF397 domain-containing protein [Streptomyces sp. NPDC057877]|uniref:DUF397 domain-containing protein n=1 Tax=Streptomyces sp. NPDC057877 TaxID=3346269 RepID=UPI003696C045
MPVVRTPASGPAWFKSSYSGGNATECLEAAFVPPGVLIRDSKHPTGPHLTVAPQAWHRFLTVVRSRG